jgi:hypothetical protein
VLPAGKIYYLMVLKSNAVGIAGGPFTLMVDTATAGAPPSPTSVTVPTQANPKVGTSAQPVIIQNKPKKSKLPPIQKILDPLHGMNAPI